MKIGRNKHNPKFTLGDMNLKYTDKYQYLWLCAKQQKQPRRPHQSNKSKSRECLPNATLMVPSDVHANFGADSPRNKKVLGTPFFPGPGRQLAGNKNFSNIEMQTIWQLTQSCIISTIAFSIEIWSPGKTENEKVNRIMDNILKRILMVPQSTPREALYKQTGLLDPEAIRLKTEC